MLLIHESLVEEAIRHADQDARAITCSQSKGDTWL